MKVTARATRAGRWWAIEIPEVPGAFTQARRLDQVPSLVADVVALLQDASAAEVEVEVVATTDHDSLVAAAREARDVAVAAQARASDLLRQAALALIETAELTVRDTGSILGVSPQQVSQLHASRRPQD